MIGLQEVLCVQVYHDNGVVGATHVYATRIP